MSSFNLTDVQPCLCPPESKTNCSRRNVEIQAEPKVCEYSLQCWWLRVPDLEKDLVPFRADRSVSPVLCRTELGLCILI